LDEHGREGHESEPDPESNIWRLTRSGSGVLIFGAGHGFGVNFSDSAPEAPPEKTSGGTKMMSYYQWRS